MKDGYDFSNTAQGKFFVPVEDIQTPVYLDRDILQFLNIQGAKSGESLETLVNDLLRKDIEIAKHFS